MTTYQLREICQKERLVVPMGSRMEREELIRFIMRYRGSVSTDTLREIQKGESKGFRAFWIR